jgi:hypothetical protein
MSRILCLNSPYQRTLINTVLARTRTPLWVTRNQAAIWPNSVYSTPATPELPVPSINRKSVQSKLASSTSSFVTNKPPGVDFSGIALGSIEEGKLHVLYERIERVREEKARLEKIQNLKELEERTMAETLAVEREPTGP